MDNPVLIEHEGALYRSYTREWPQEIWNPETQAWGPYAGKDDPEPKPVDWGTVITPAEFDKLKHAT